MNDDLDILAEITNAEALRELATRDAAPREKILAFQEAVARCPSTMHELVPRHHFAPGAYARELFVPAGRLVVGKIHKHAHINVLSMGRCTVFTEDGLVELEAPATFVSSPGTKRAVLTHTDIVWTTVHATNETDLAKLEFELIVPSYDELDRIANDDANLRALP